MVIGAYSLFESEGERRPCRTQGYSSVIVREATSGSLGFFRERSKQHVGKPGAKPRQRGGESPEKTLCTKPGMSLAKRYT